MMYFLKFVTLSFLRCTIKSACDISIKLDRCCTRTPGGDRILVARLYISDESCSYSSSCNILHDGYSAQFIVCLFWHTYFS